MRFQNKGSAGQPVLERQTINQQQQKIYFLKQILETYFRFQKSIKSKTNLCIYYFWLCWVFVVAHRLYLVATIGGYSVLRYAGFSLQWLLLLQSISSRCTGIRSCGLQAREHMGSRSCDIWTLVAPRHVEISQTRVEPVVPCTGRWTPIHCTIREVPENLMSYQREQEISYEGHEAF